MSSKATSLKAKIRNYAKSNNITAQVVLQNYMFERFLARLSSSEYRDKFVIKGGMLVAAIVGLDTRSTMDLDTTLKNLPLTEEKIKEAITTVCSIDLKDDVTFQIVSIGPIRKDDKYGGYCVRLNALYDTMITALSIDVSTGDVITPSPIKYEFSGIFDEELKINLWGYNIETVLAEKVETILSHSIFTTRPRDFYDVYILATTQNFNKEIFFDALWATSEHRGSKEQIKNIAGILNIISESSELKNMWSKYQSNFPYAQEISYENILTLLNDLLL